MTQSTLATRMNCSQQYISKIVKWKSFSRNNIKTRAHIEYFNFEHQSYIVIDVCCRECGGLWRVTKIDAFFDPLLFLYCLSAISLLKSRGEAKVEQSHSEGWAESRLLRHAALTIIVDLPFCVCMKWLVLLYHLLYHTSILLYRNLICLFLACSTRPEHCHHSFCHR